MIMPNDSLECLENNKAVMKLIIDQYNLVKLAVPKNLILIA